MKLLNYNRIKLGKFNHFFGDPKKQSDACESESLKFGHTSGAQKRKSVSQSLVRPIFAEREGFEPPDPLRSTVFKTAAFDHSAISPIFFELGSIPFGHISRSKRLQR